MTYELKNGLTIVVGNDTKTIDTLSIDQHVKPSNGVPFMFEIYHHSKYNALMKGVFDMVKHNTELNPSGYKVWLRVTSLDVLKSFVQIYNLSTYKIEARVVRFTIDEKPCEIYSEAACRLVNDGREIR